MEKKFTTRTELIIGSEGIPHIVIVLAGIFITIGVLGVRVSLRFYRRMVINSMILIKKDEKDEYENILIVGAGACGLLIIDEIRKQNPVKQKVVALIDDDLNKVGTYLRGIKILGTREKIKSIVKEKNIDTILIAMPSVGGKDKKDIIEVCRDTKKNVKIIPGMYELIDDKVSLSRMRDVDLRDLLGRDEVKLDKEGIKDYIENKVVLVTGGGGSIGSELCRQIARFSPKLLLILDIYENNAYELQNELRRKMPDLK